MTNEELAKIEQDWMDDLPVTHHISDLIDEIRLLKIHNKELAERIRELSKAK